MPGLCCYDIEGHIPYASCFTQMQVQLNSGSFANIQAGTDGLLQMQRIPVLTLIPTQLLFLQEPFTLQHFV